ncbi:monocarboxylate transporter 12-like isoform X2 [Ostrea edulis]|nr:monocarboxylate transporter 12-like isoform X2 [Ostrea edulis]
MGIGIKYFTERTLVVGGALFGLTSNIGSAFAPNSSTLFFTQGVLFGLSTTFAHLSSTLLVGKYFERRRGMANGIINLGGSIGGLAWPPVITYLLNDYGLQGTLLIVGAVCLHLIPVGLLMRPIDLGAKEESTHSLEIATGFEEGNEHLVSPSNHDPENCFIETESSQIEQSSEAKIERNCCRQCSSLIFNFALFKNSSFLLLVVMSFLVSFGCVLPLTYIPPFAEDRGIQRNRIGYLVTISAASDIVSRTIFIFLADNRKVKRYHMMAIGLMGGGVVCLLANFYTTFITISVFSALHIFLAGTYFSLINVVMVDFIGLRNLNHGLAMSTVTRGISSAVGSLSMGLIRDESGSYVGGFMWMGACLILGGLSLLVKPFLSKRAPEQTRTSEGKL